MNQLRRKTSFTERKKTSVGRLFRPSESSDRKNGGIPETKESDLSEGKENKEPERGEALDCIPLIEVLDLSWNVGIGAGNFRHFTEQIQPENRLKDLRLVDCQLSETDITALSEALPLLSGLEELDLSNNKLSIKGMENLTSSFSATPRLRTLKLSMCGLGKDHLSALGQAFRFITALEHMDLSCNKEAGGGLSTLAANLLLLTHLRSLDMHLCCLTKDDVLTLVQVAPSLKELRELDLSSNKSVGDTLQNLLQSLPLSQMTKLPLNNCDLSDSACQALATVMQTLKRLESLNLSWNKCVGENLREFLEPLQADCKLQELRLSSCNLTTEDVLHLGFVRMKAGIVFLTPLLFPLVSAQVFRWGPCPTPMVQPNFELDKYLGKWYEIEKLPASFEKGKCIEANYMLRPDKTVQVLNIQTYKGKIRKAEGTAIIQDIKEPAKLGVSFSYFTPYAPYWILSTDYNSISLVYSCTDVLRLFHVDYAWILSRSRFLPAEAVYHAKEIFSRDNIDVSKMFATDQQGCDNPI